jgi:hypothetical protein
LEVTRGKKREGDLVEIFGLTSFHHFEDQFGFGVTAVYLTVVSGVLKSKYPGFVQADIAF